MAGLRDWLQLFRSHTSPLEVSIAVLGAGLAQGTLWHLDVLLFAIFGWLYHNVGYGQNSVEDYIRGYDTKDPHKAHHPLHRGAIEPERARAVINAMMVATALYAVFIAYPSIIAAALLGVIVAMGMVYNLWGKRLRWKFVPIAIAHSLLFPFAYFGSGGSFSPHTLVEYGHIDLSILLFFLYFLVQIVYQILIEGDLKDIDMIKKGEASLLEHMGVEVVGGKFTASIGARFLSAMIKGLNIALGVAILAVYSGPINIPYLSAFLFFGGVMLYLDRELMRPRTFNHASTLRHMALMEVFTVFGAVVLAMPLIGLGGGLFLIVLDIAYFALMNRYLWGTVIRPKV